MAARSVDYEGMLSVYDRISRQRSLDEVELERVIELVRLQKQQKSSASYRERNKERCAQNRKNWDTLNPEKRVAAKKKWQQANPECGRRASRAYQQRNKAKVVAYGKKYREENREYFVRRELELAVRDAKLHCGQCAAEFVTTRRNAAEASRGVLKFCTKKCAYAHPSAKRILDLVCTECGRAAQVVTSSLGTPPSTCGRPCWLARANRLRKLRKLQKINPSAT